MVGFTPVQGAERILGLAVVRTLVQAVVRILALAAVRTLGLAVVRILVRAAVRILAQAVGPTLVQAVGLTLGRVGLVTPAPVAALTISGTDRLPTADSWRSFRSPETRRLTNIQALAFALTRIKT